MSLKRRGNRKTGVLTLKDCKNEISVLKRNGLTLKFKVKNLQSRIDILEKMFKSRRTCSMEFSQEFISGKSQFLETPRSGNDRAYWAKLQPHLPKKGRWCTPGSVVGVFEDGVGPPSVDALFLAVCAAEPDTLGSIPYPPDYFTTQQPTPSFDSHFVAIAVVGEVPVRLTEESDLSKFRSGSSSEYLCVDQSGSVRIWDRVSTGVRVFALALRQHTHFDADGYPEVFQGVKGIRSLVSHQVECSALRIEQSLKMPPSTAIELIKPASLASFATNVIADRELISSDLRSSPPGLSLPQDSPPDVCQPTTQPQSQPQQLPQSQQSNQLAEQPPSQHLSLFSTLQSRLTELRLSAPKFYSLEGLDAEIELFNVTPDGASSIPHWVAGMFDQTNKFLSSILPTAASLNDYHTAFRFTRDIVGAALGIQLFPAGSMLSGTFLPGEAIDATAFTVLSTDELWYIKVHESLSEMSLGATNRPMGGSASHQQMRELLLHNNVVDKVSSAVNAVNEKSVRSIVNGINIGISVNQLVPLYYQGFICLIDDFVGSNHLFKRSLVLVKAWCKYESERYTEGKGTIYSEERLSSWAVTVMLTWIFNSEGFSISNPLQALGHFLGFYASFNWSKYAITVHGPVSAIDLSILPPEEYSQLFRTGDVIPSEFLDRFAARYSAVRGASVEAYNPLKASFANASAAAGGAGGCGIDDASSKLPFNWGAAMAFSKGDDYQCGVSRGCVNIVDPILPGCSVSKQINAEGNDSITRALSHGYKAFQQMCDEGKAWETSTATTGRGLQRGLGGQSGGLQGGQSVTTSPSGSSVNSGFGSARDDRSLGGADPMLGFDGSNVLEFFTNTVTTMASRPQPPPLSLPLGWDPQYHKVDILASQPDDLEMCLQHAELILASVVSMSAVIHMIAHILSQKKVSISIGEVGKILHEMTGSDSVIKRVKKQCGGLKRLIEETRSPLVELQNTHPSNPNVALGVVWSGSRAMIVTDPFVDGAIPPILRFDNGLFRVVPLDILSQQHREKVQREQLQREQQQRELLMQQQLRDEYGVTHAAMPHQQQQMQMQMQPHQLQQQPLHQSKQQQQQLTQPRPDFSLSPPSSSLLTQPGKAYAQGATASQYYSQQHAQTQPPLQAQSYTQRRQEQQQQQQQDFHDRGSNHHSGLQQHQQLQYQPQRSQHQQQQHHQPSLMSKPGQSNQQQQQQQFHNRGMSPAFQLPHPGSTQAHASRPQNQHGQQQMPSQSIPQSPALPSYNLHHRGDGLADFADATDGSRGTIMAGAGPGPGRGYAFASGAAGAAGAKKGGRGAGGRGGGAGAVDPTMLHLWGPPPSSVDSAGNGSGGVSSGSGVGGGIGGVAGGGLSRLGFRDTDVGEARDFSFNSGMGLGPMGHTGPGGQGDQAAAAGAYYDGYDPADFQGFDNQGFQSRQADSSGYFGTSQQQQQQQQQQQYSRAPGSAPGLGAKPTHPFMPPRNAF